MITYQVNGTGDTISYEEKSLPYVQALEMETQTGVTANKYLTQLDEGSAKSTAILFWLGAVNHAAARDGVSFRDASRVLTFEQFTEDLDVLATMATVRRPVPVAADPTSAGSGSAEPTSPGTSEPLSPSTPSPAPAATTSDSSPTSSASAPGSGTSSTSPTSNA